MSAYFVPSIPTFIPESWKKDGSYSDETWPSDATLVSDEIASKYWMVTPPDGKRLGSVKGNPAWVDIPPPTQEELISQAEIERKRRVLDANEFMNSKQWPGKAAIGRLKGDELASYNLWLDYLDALLSLDVSSAPNVKWPGRPQP
ncbi:tail fiber assembly protein [Enterobacter roggenkampii]|uniref:tail fiber assembly protein n=1 Tax=Enterobacter roggenkampii TaxID=1812935 RepID=UPI0020034A36|nr:tail fiber assembly protein [Enterobacter roggenkampii]MCK6984028.1 tail fiber assembly protein [Enterobacter roggenkampii]